MKSFKKLMAAACAALIASVVVMPGRADSTAAYSFTGTENDLAGYGLSGILFKPTQNILLTDLGFTGVSLNAAGDLPHVTLWNASGGLGSLVQMYDTGNIISSVTSYDVDSGAQPSYVSVGTPIELTAGVTYLISAPAYWVPTYDSSGVLPTADFSTFTFVNTNGTVGGGGWGGWDNTGYNFSTLVAAPNSNLPTTVSFLYSADSPAVPEPSTYVMLGTGLLLLFIFQRRRLARTT